MSISIGRRSRRLSGFLMALVAVVATARVGSAQSIPSELVSYPSLILHNGKVITVDAKFTIAEAVAVRDGKFLKIGTNKDVLALKGPNTQVIDLQGRSVVPGFIDPHGHGHIVSPRGSGMVSGGNLTCPTKAECLEQIKAGVAKAKPGEWVRFNGLRNTVLVTEMTRWDFDTVSPNNPIWISARSTMSWVNSKAWEIVGERLKAMEGAFKDPKTGEPNGHIRGQANGVLDAEFSEWPKDWWTPANLEEQKKRDKVLASHGITTNVGRTTGLGISVLNELNHRGELIVRMRPVMEFAFLNPEAEAYLKRVGNLTGIGDDMLKIPGMTVGPPDGQTNEGGAMSTLVPRNKLDQPGGVPWDMMGPNRYLAGENKWASSRTDQDWKGKGTEYETIILANRYGWSIQGIHTQGDIGAKMMLAAYEEANKERPLKGRFFAYDHAMIRDESDLKRAAALDVNNSFNPGYVFGENNRGQIYMFGEYVHQFSPVKSAINAGLKAGLEMEGQFQEGKVASLIAIGRFVTRTDEKGQVWGAKEAISRQEGLRMATLWNANYAGDEKTLGSIEPGKLADMVVLHGDYMTVPEKEIRNLLLDLTIMGGKVVYDRVKDGGVMEGPRATEG